MLRGGCGRSFSANQEPVTGKPVPSPCRFAASHCVESAGNAAISETPPLRLHILRRLVQEHTTSAALNTDCPHIVCYTRAPRFHRAALYWLANCTKMASYSLLLRPSALCGPGAMRPVLRHPTCASCYGTVVHVSCRHPLGSRRSLHRGSSSPVPARTTMALVGRIQIVGLVFIRVHQHVSTLLGREGPLHQLFYTDPPPRPGS